MYIVLVFKVKLMWKFFWYIGFVWMSDELRINEKEYENDINCKDCYEMNKWFLGVNVILIILDRYI